MTSPYRRFLESQPEQVPLNWPAIHKQLLVLSGLTESQAEWDAQQLKAARTICRRIERQMEIGLRAWERSQ